MIKINCKGKRKHRNTCRKNNNRFKKFKLKKRAKT